MASPDGRYFEQANGWDVDRERIMGASVRRAWMVAGTATMVAGLAVAALTLLVPLKRTEPFLIRVDSSTGIADVVPAYLGTAALPETVIRHLVNEYVTLRERYIPALAESDYEQVGAYQSGALNQAWADAWTRTNPESPLNRYSSEDRVLVQVQSVTFLHHAQSGSDVIQVRIRRGVQHGGSGDAHVEHFVSTLTARFGPPSSDPHVRSLNPLGFSVLEYRREPELADPGPNGGAGPSSGGAS